MIIIPKRTKLTPSPSSMVRGPYAQNLMMLLSCNEAGGSVIRSTDGLNLATFHNPGWRSGPWGSAALLDGSTSWIEVPAHPSFNSEQNLNTTQSFSIVVNLLWTASSEAYGMVYSEEDGGAFNLALFIKSSGDLATYYQAGNVDPIPSFTLSPGWHQLVWTNGIDGGERVYVDGVRIYQSNTFGGPSVGISARRARIGGNSIFGSGRYISGAVSMVAKWGRQLNGAEVQRLWQDPASLYGYRRQYWLAGASSDLTLTGTDGLEVDVEFGTGGTVGNTGDQFIIGADGLPVLVEFGVGGITPAGVLTGQELAVRVEFGVGVMNLQTVGDPASDGLEVDVEFGTGALTHTIRGLNGLPVQVAFGQGALLMAGSPFTLFIGGVDCTALLKVNTLSITMALDQRWTLDCILLDPSGEFHPDPNDEFLFYQGTTRLYGGRIEECTESVWQGGPTTNISIKVSDFSGVLDHLVIGKYYTLNQAGALEIIVADIVNLKLAPEGISYDSQDGSPAFGIGNTLFGWITIRDAFQQLQSLVGWDYQIDEWKILRWFPANVGIGPAPFTLRDEDGHWIAESMTVRRYLNQYRNREYVTGAPGSNLWCDTFSAAIPGPYPSSNQSPDGIIQEFITLYGLQDTPSITINSVKVPADRIITLDQRASLPASSWDWYWESQQGAPNPSPGVFQNPINTPLQPTDVLVVCYPSNVPPVTVVQNSVQIAALKATTGGSGLFESVDQFSGSSDPAAILAFGNGQLVRYGVAGFPRDIQFDSDSIGWKPGQRIDANVTQPFVIAGNYMITNVAIKDVDKRFLRYTVQATNTAFQGDWLSYFRLLQRNGQQLTSRAVETVTIQFEIVGTTVISSPPFYNLQNKSFFRDLSLQFDSPTSSDFVFNVECTTGAFNLGPVGNWTLPADSADPVTFYNTQPPNNSPLALEKGSRLILVAENNFGTRKGVMTITFTIA